MQELVPSCDFVRRIAVAILAGWPRGMSLDFVGRVAIGIFAGWARVPSTGSRALVFAKEVRDRIRIRSRLGTLVFATQVGHREEGRRYPSPVSAHPSASARALVSLTCCSECRDRRDGEIDVGLVRLRRSRFSTPGSRPAAALPSRLR